MAHEHRIKNNKINTEKDYILFVDGMEFKFDSFEGALNFVTPRCTSCNRVLQSILARCPIENNCTNNCFSQAEDFFFHSY